MAESRRKQMFPDVTDEQWNDWKWQVKNRIETLEDLKKYVALLFPTRWVGESQAGTLSESCIALLPAIASDWRCNCEMVLDGKNGYLYPGQYAKTLEEAIEYFIEHKDNIYELRKNCSELAEQYQPDVHIKHIVEIIESN